jgi:hypothetical protein
LSASTGNRWRCLPVIELRRVRKIANLGEQLTLLTTTLNRAAEFHSALIFLLTAGFDGAVAFFVGLGHFESPKAITGVSR